MDLPPAQLYWTPQRDCPAEVDSKIREISKKANMTAVQFSCVAASNET